MKNSISSKTFSKYLVFTVVLFALFIMSAPSLAAIPKAGSIAILTKGPSAQHMASVASILTRELISNGYKVVDPATLEQIRRNKAAEAALRGDVNAIMNLGRQYGFSTMITATLEAGMSVLNEFQLHTGTSSIAIMAMSSGGQMIYADTVSGKQVGYTADEAEQKAIEAAARVAAKRMLE